MRIEAGIDKDCGVQAAAQIGRCAVPARWRDVHHETLFNEAFSDDHSGWIKVLERIRELTGRSGFVSCSRALGQGAAATSPIGAIPAKMAVRRGAWDIHRARANPVPA